MRALASTIVVVFGCGPSARSPGGHATSPAPSCDTSTADAQHAVYKRVTSLDLVPPQGHEYDQTCLQASTRFPGLLTIGTFASEIGCQWVNDGRDSDPSSPTTWTGAIYDCTFTKSANAVAGTAMSRAGWAVAGPAKRIQLAWTWLREVEHVVPLQVAPAVAQWPAAKTFSPPTAEPSADGGVMLTFWLSNPTMGQGFSYSQQSVTFSIGGVPSAPVALDDASIE